MGFNTMFDLFCVNNAALALCSLFRSGWLVYLAIPGYGVFKLGGYLWSWLDSKPEDADGEEIDPKLAKKLEKQKKKEEKPKIKVLKK